MSWIKNTVVDIAITVVIAMYALMLPVWAWWIIAIYTPLMVLLKVFALSGAANAVQRKASDVPSWFYHVLYAANVGLLLYASFLYAAIGWAVIWILSAMAEAKNKPKKRK